MVEIELNITWFLARSRTFDSGIERMLQDGLRLSIPRAFLAQELG
jgi:hypothetical protein